MTKTIALLSILLSSLVFAADPLPLYADDYTLKVTQEALHPKMGGPSDKVPDNSYLPAKKQADLRLRFSKDRKKVYILPGEISGVQTSGDGSKRVYLLKKGLFAGGRLTVEKTKKGLVTTFTVFGSGVPVISSKRGVIKPTTPKA